MKRICFIAVFVFGISSASSAQSYWFDDNSSQQRSLSDGGLTEGSDSPVDPQVPVGEGTLILAALAGGYGVWRSRL
jgi:hypothetical protein